MRLKDKVAFMLFAIMGDYFEYGSYYYRLANGKYVVHIDGENKKYTAHALADEYDLLKHTNRELHGEIMHDFTTQEDNLCV